MLKTFSPHFPLPVFLEPLLILKSLADFIIEFYDGGFAPELNVLMIKEIIALIRSYVYEIRKQKAVNYI